MQIIIVLIIAIVCLLVVARFLSGEGCGGDCRQGRDPCNCRNNPSKGNKQ